MTVVCDGTMKFREGSLQSYVLLISTKCPVIHCTYRRTPVSYVPYSQDANLVMFGFWFEHFLLYIYTMELGTSSITY